MPSAKDIYDVVSREILQDASESIMKIDQEQLQRMVDLLIMTKAKDKRVLLVGAGRSGLVARAFALRLMHLGFNVFVHGETITPAVGKGDLVIAISGSGSTKLVVTAAEIAKGLGSKVLAVTSRPDSPLAKVADQTMIVIGRTKEPLEKDYLSRQIIGEHEPLAPLGTIFEIACGIFLDCVIVILMSLLEETESEIRKRHVTIE
ncbi:MAG: 6-phospho-3-hexuloisomerase [Thermoproteota archaeon]